MSLPLGAGWHLTHLTDRVIELTKDDPVYRRFTGRDGYVRLRAEPGMDRKALIEKALKMGIDNDKRLALRVGKQLIPSMVALARYTGKQLCMERVFAVPGEESSDRVYKP